MWDDGGKFLMVMKDDSINRMMLISFFAVERNIKENNQGYDLSNNIEYRFLGTLAGTDLT